MSQDNYEKELKELWIIQCICLGLSTLALILAL